MDAIFKAPVTALKFFNEILIAGEGPYVKLFDVQKGNLLCRELVLPRRRIHGISLAVEDGDERLLVLFGQTDMRIAKLEGSGNLSVVGEVVQFSDWILDVQWLDYHHEGLTSTTPDCMAVATAHNQVTLWNWRDKRVTALVDCEVHCILYSFRFHGCQSQTLWAASGTVFHDILLWPVVATETKARVAAQLQGHKGVIFSIQFNSSRHILCSASDDRSICLWNTAAVIGDEPMRQTIQLLVPVTILYGHTARVWDAHFISDHIISIGEDAACCVWGPAVDKSCIHRFTGHKGRGIWSLAVSETHQIVATGGGDTSIRLCSGVGQFLYVEHDRIDCSLPDCGRDFPRLVKLVDVNTAIVFSNTGRIYMYKMSCHVSDGPGCHDWTCTCIGKELTYESYSVLAMSPSRDKLAIGSLDGRIKIISIGTKDEEKEWQAYDGKVFGLIWNKNDTLFSTGPDGVVVCWSIVSHSKENIPSALFRCILPPCKHRWVTALTMVQTTVNLSGSLVLVCGDRSGSVHLYCVSMDGLHDYTPLQSFRGLHGKHGVSHICSDGGLVYSVGRNGVFTQYEFSDGQLIMVNKIVPIKGMEWIEQMFFTNGQCLLVSGFRSTDFVLMNWKTGETVLKCYCGGAHRAWDFYMNDELSIAAFAYLKGKQLHMVQKQLQKIARPLLQEPFHGREAVSMCVVQEDSISGQAIVATGSEDCDIMLWNFKPGVDLAQMELQHLMTCPGHVSSVRALCPAMYMSDQGGHLVLFSGGGRASLKCWHVVLHASPGVTKKASVHCESSPDYIHAHSVAELNQSLQWHRKQTKQSDESESRVMALTSFHSKCLDCSKGLDDGYIVISGWSDGQIRFHHFSDKRRNFMCLLELAFHSHCILSVSHLAICSERGRHKWMVIAFTAATDGQIALWDCQDLFSCHTDSSDVEKPVHGHQNPILVYRAHQSGVNDIAISCHSELGGWLIVSGGDDNSLYGALLTNSTESSKVGWCTTASGLNSHAHCSSITGVVINNAGHVVSVSVDQTIRRWSISVTDQTASSDMTKSLQWKLLQCCFTNVADVEALVLLPKGHIGVCGAGIEVIKFEQEGYDENQQTTEHSLE